MRLTLVIPSLELGGAERVVATLANAWAERGRDVTVVIFAQNDGPSYPLSAKVTLRNLEMVSNRARYFFQAVHRNVQRVRRLRRALQESRPDVVISFIDFPNILTLLATRGLGVPVVVSERANPDLVDIGLIWRTLRRWMYPRADALVCQTRAMLALLQARINVAGYVIPNPVPPSSAKGRREGGGRERVLIAMGRLVPQKGFDLLLDAFARIADRHPEWSVTIIGNGPLKDELQAQAESVGLGGRLRFAGHLVDPFPVLCAADLFVFSSRFEGFGNALAEAMACGLPVISFDCPAGPSDLIRHGVDGILVPSEDVASLAAAMDDLMSNAQRRESLARRAPEVVQRFSLERVLALWEELFDEVVPGNHPPREAAYHASEQARSH